MPNDERTAAEDAIKAGLRVSLDLRLKDGVSGTENVLTLSSIVEELLEDGYMLIHMPIYQGYYYPLHQDDSVLMKFRVDSELYALYIAFEERVERKNLVFAKVRRIGRIKLHQQRDCYRLPCFLPTTFERVGRSETPDKGQSRIFEGTIVNFSDGGMLFATAENIRKGEKLTFTFDLNETETVEGTVLRTERKKKGDYLFRVAVRFQSEDVFQKRRFYKYIIDKQLEERRRWTSKGKPLY